MTIQTIYTLHDVIAEAIRETGGGSTSEVVAWLQMNRRKVLDDNRLTIENVGLGSMVRGFRKTRTASGASASTRQLCLDFGLPELDLHTEIGIPTDMNNLLNGECEWLEWDDVTIDQIDRSIELIKAQRSALDNEVTNRSLVRQAAARIVPGRTNIPLRKLREIARKQQGMS